MIQFELDHALDTHQHWLRDRRFGRRADFTGRKLEDLNIKYKDLSGAVLDGANLHRCDISNSNLTDVTANSAHFDSVDFTDTNLKNAHLQDALFTNCTMERTDLWNVLGNGTQLITLQIGGRHVIYTSEILQINCKQFELDKVWWMSEDDAKHRLRGNTDAEQAESLAWWCRWKTEIYQIINKNPATSIK